MPAGRAKNARDRRAGLEPKNVLNALTLAELETVLQKRARLAG
jgi:hypothetical protein